MTLAAKKYAGGGEEEKRMFIRLERLVYGLYFKSTAQTRWGMKCLYNLFRNRTRDGSVPVENTQTL